MMMNIDVQAGYPLSLSLWYEGEMRQVGDSPKRRDELVRHRECR
jgi:hypothetical protein